MAKAKRHRQKLLAVVGDECTGCGGTPVCMAWCPTEGALYYVRDGDGPLGRVWVDPNKCSGCTGCVSRGYLGSFVQGCPWNAITMVPVEEASESVQRAEAL